MQKHALKTSPGSFAKCKLFCMSCLQGYTMIRQSVAVDASCQAHALPCWSCKCKPRCEIASAGGGNEGTAHAEVAGRASTVEPALLLAPQPDQLPAAGLGLHCLQAQGMPSCSKCYCVNYPARMAPFVLDIGPRCSQGPALFVKKIHCFTGLGRQDCINSAQPKVYSKTKSFCTTEVLHLFNLQIKEAVIEEQGHTDRVDQALAHAESHLVRGKYLEAAKCLEKGLAGMSASQNGFLDQSLSRSLILKEWQLTAKQMFSTHPLNCLEDYHDASGCTMASTVVSMHARLSTWACLLEGNWKSPSLQHL